MKAMAGVVLCGGGSRRMGADKALLELDGQPLVLRVAGLLAEAADPVFLAPGRPGRLGDLGYAELEDPVPDAGPLAGLAAGLEPLHAVYSTSALGEARLALHDGRLGLRDLVERLRVREVPEPEWRPVDPQGRFALNVNSPRDLTSLK